MHNLERYNRDHLVKTFAAAFELATRSSNLDEYRQKIAAYIHTLEYETFEDYGSFTEGSIIRVRDCARAIKSMLTRRSENRAGFSVAQALWNMAWNVPRPDLTQSFYAEIYHLFLGLHGKGSKSRLVDQHLAPSLLSGREAAQERSRQLDGLGDEVAKRTARYVSGLEEDAIRRRAERRRRILSGLNADEPDSTHDRSIRAQVIPPIETVQQLSQKKSKDRSCLDFMLESDTSPIDLVTRRYLAVCILKPYNTCPPICVYCQRNWEIEDAMMPDALASEKQIEQALRWIQRQPAIREVLVTGGDPFAMTDSQLEWILDCLADIGEDVSDYATLWYYY
jgi:lysine 2,3-aminomutase